MENNLELLPTLEIFSYLFSENENSKFKKRETPNEDEKTSNFGPRSHRKSLSSQRNMWNGLTKDVENFIRCEAGQKVKVCRTNMNTPPVIKETPKSPSSTQVYPVN